MMDNWIKLIVGHRLASSVLALRPAVEALIVRMCEDPEKIAEPTEDDKNLIAIIQVSEDDDDGDDDDDDDDV